MRKDVRPEAGKLPQCDGADGNVAEAGIIDQGDGRDGGKPLLLPEKSKYQNEEEG